MNITERELQDLATKLGDGMRTKGLKLAAAESCTGGWLAKIITDIPGSSAWFVGSVVSYSNEAKQSLLGVSQQTLKEFGAVSGETVLEMSKGLFAHTDADVVVSVSGVAGPGGGSEDKPVGLVWLAWGKRGESTLTSSYIFDGNREQVRMQSIKQIATCLLSFLVSDDTTACAVDKTNH